MSGHHVLLGQVAERAQSDCVSVAADATDADADAADATAAAADATGPIPTPLVERVEHGVAQVVLKHQTIFIITRTTAFTKRGSFWRKLDPYGALLFINNPHYHPTAAAGFLPLLITDLRAEAGRRRSCEERRRRRRRLLLRLPFEQSATESVALMRNSPDEIAAAVAAVVRAEVMEKSVGVVVVVVVVVVGD